MRFPLRFRLVLGLVAICGVFLTLSASAYAQCTRDTDCKGDRVCNAGVCVDPAPPAAAGPSSRPGEGPIGPGGAPAPAPVYSPSPPPVAAPAPYYAPPQGYFSPSAPTQYQAPTSPGWASGAGTYGIVAGIVFLGLAVASESAKQGNDGDQAAGVGGVATAIFGISLPIVAVGGSSARDNPEVKGISGLRVAGWIGYAATLLDAITLIALKNIYTPPDGQIVSVGLLGAASMSCFVADAYASAREANQILGRDRASRLSLSTRFGMVAPFLARDRANPGRTSAGLSWIGAF
jgi:hypothetical protein